MAGTTERFLGKGMEVSLEEKLASRSYTDKEGVKRYSTEVVISVLKLLSDKVSRLMH